MKTGITSCWLAMLWILLLAGCQKNEIDPSRQSQIANPLTAGDRNVNKIMWETAPVPLVCPSSFAVLAGTTITNVGLSLITGNMGVSPGTAITGFEPAPANTIVGPGTVTGGPGLVSGTIYAGGAIAAQAHTDAVNAYNYLAAQSPNTTYTGVTQLDGLLLGPGVYHFESANLSANGTLYLDFQGNPNAQFIFQFSSTLVTMTGSKVMVVNNNYLPCKGASVYWAVGSSATIDGVQFVGNVLATASITMASGALVSGKLWALNGAVTMITDTVSFCPCSGNGTPPPPPPTDQCSDFVTGGGWIETGDHVKGENNKGTFGVSGGFINGKFWGQLSYNDHLNGIKVKSTSVTGYTVIDPVTRQIDGIAKIDGQGSFTYRVVVADNGEPGRNDTFSLELSSGYRASGSLGGGNIQLHKKCKERGDKDVEDDSPANSNNDDDRNDKDHRKR